MAWRWPLGERANPNVRVGRRNRQAVEPQNAAFFVDYLSLGVEIDEFFAATLARVARALITDIAQPRFFRDLRGRSRDFEFR